MSETSSTEKKTKKYLPRYRGHSRLMKAGNSGSLSVPSDMMSLLTEGLLFKPELTKDGILFKIVDEDKLVAEDKTVPAWVKKVAPASSTAQSVTDGDFADPEVDDGPDDAIVDDAADGDEEPPTDEAF